MKTHKFAFTLALFMTVSAGVLLVLSCGSGTGSSPSPTVRTGSATVTLSDPPVCKIPNGDVESVWVTVTRVRAHISSSAGENDGGWVDLADLTDNPMQIDLLNIPENACASEVLGVATGLPPGNYQQIRLHLLSNTPADGVAVPATNNCDGAGYNCAVFPGDVKDMLQLSSQDQTGIKIPPGRIAGGAISIEAGQMANINIDFNTCASLIRQGNGQLRLKPTLHAGEVSMNTSVGGISGKVVQGATGANPGEAIAGAIVLLEQVDTDGIDRAKMSAVTDSGGQFVFCPLPEGDGPYDLVAAASIFDSNAGVTTTYNATVAFDVPVGTALGDIPLVPEITTDTSTMPATITGDVTTDASGMTVDVSALQEATANSTTRKVTVPVFGALSQPPNVTTAAPTAPDTCTDGAAACADYSLQVPASNPSVGAFIDGSVTFGGPAADPVSYSVNGVASGCTGATTPTSPILISLEVTQNMTTPAGTTMVFTTCTTP
jgi:hypothetical protein